MVDCYFICAIRCVNFVFVFLTFRKSFKLRTRGKLYAWNKLRQKIRSRSVVLGLQVTGLSHLSDVV